MMTLASIEAQIEGWRPGTLSPEAQADEMLQWADDILVNWLLAHEREPTDERREGFRLIALHRQAARGNASFNACRETCRELAYRFNLVKTEPESDATRARLEMMRRLVHHLVLFISGKLQSAELGEFCCASRPLRQSAEQPH